jgi:predicted nucleotidyltransferase
MNLLIKRQQRRLQQREELRIAVRETLRAALHELAPGEKVLIFGSLTRPYAFHEKSDVDIAFIEEPQKFSRYGLQSRLEEWIRRPVDVLILGECRFGPKIEREGEAWTI